MFVFASRMGNDWWKILLPLQRLRYESILAPHLYPVRWFIEHLISCSTPPGSKFGRVQIWVMYNIWRWTFTLYKQDRPACGRVSPSWSRGECNVCMSLYRGEPQKRT